MLTKHFFHCQRNFFSVQSQFLSIHKHEKTLRITLKTQKDHVNLVEHAQGTIFPYVITRVSQD